MKDINLYIDKLHADAEDCLSISRTATNDAKRNVFATMAETYRTLAGDLERIAAANAILDEHRERNLLGMLSGGSDGSDSLAEIAKVRSVADGSGNAPA
jgi:hypothetical protein